MAFLGLGKGCVGATGLCRGGKAKNYAASPPWPSLMGPVRAGWSFLTQKNAEQKLKNVGGDKLIHA